MPSRTQEITATVGQIKWRSDDETSPFVILDAVLASPTSTPEDQPSRQSRLILKGNMDGEHPQQHLTYRFYGVQKETEFRGEPQTEFKFSTFVMAAPHGRAGVITYLTNAPNIGRILAGRLWDKFKGDAVKILREKPEVAAAACERLSVDGAIEASEWLARESALEDCMIELVELLDGRGFPKKTAKDVVKEYGNLAAQLIRQNPYLVMNFRGCGFKRADALYLDLGLPPAKLKRQALCAWHCVAQQGEGHTWVYRGVIDQGLAGAIGGADVKVERAIQLADRGGYLSLQRTDGVDGPPDWDGSTLYVAEAKKARNEARLAGYVVEALTEES